MKNQIGSNDKKKRLAGFLQSGSFLSIGFCLTEVPVALVLNDSE